MSAQGSVRSAIAAMAMALLVAPAPPGVAGWFENTQPTADLIRNVVDNASLKRGGERHILLLWQRQPANLQQLEDAISLVLPAFKVTSASLRERPPYEAVLKSLFSDRSLVCVVAIDLDPDALQMLSYHSRRSSVLTIGSDDDVDPLAVGLRVSSSMVYCSDAALRDERVTIKEKEEVCRPVPGEWKNIDSDARLPKGSKAFRKYLDARKLIRSMKRPIDDAQRPGLFRNVRVLQHFIAASGTERSVELSGDVLFEYLPHFDLGLAMYVVGNCEAAAREFESSYEQKYVQKTDQLSQLYRLRDACRSELPAVRLGAAAGESP